MSQSTDTQTLNDLLSGGTTVQSIAESVVEIAELTFDEQSDR
jgi:hypothetical protein